MIMSRVLKISGIVLFILLAVAGLIVWKYDFPKKINLTFPAVEFRAGDPSSVDKTTITINGTLHRKMFRSERFTGWIEIEKYELTHPQTNKQISKEMMAITFNKKIFNGFGVLTYIRWYLKPSGAVKGVDSVSQGYIWKEGEFESVKLNLILSTEEREKTDNELELAAPALDYDSAMALEQMYNEQNKKIQ